MRYLIAMLLVAACNGRGGQTPPPEQKPTSFEVATEHLQIKGEVKAGFEDELERLKGSVETGAKILEMP